MTAVDNEKLCALAQTGDMDALNSLVENNLRFIKMTAHEIWSAQIEVNRALGVTFDDLVQEGCLGLMGCVEKFNPDGGNKFLTYASPAIRNSMIDYIRSQSTSFEAKHMGEIVSLDIKDAKNGETKIVTFLLPDNGRAYVLNIRLKGADVIEPKTIQPGETTITLELTGVGTQDYTLYIDGNLLRSEKVTFIDE